MLPVMQQSTVPFQQGIWCQPISQYLLQRYAQGPAAAPTSLVSSFTLCSFMLKLHAMGHRRPRRSHLKAAVSK